ncbi:hypothetical protein CDIK_0132 [Cucumispora dikerogammari]|nr:hypothetical protein CDIK_0132 [Cucumispora dikerogammari]
MNELLVSRFLLEPFDCINDLTSAEFETFRVKYFQKHKKYLSDIGFIKRLVLISGNELCKYMYGIKGLYNGMIRFTHTRVRLGTKHIMIPIEIDIMMELIFSKDLNKRGLFRRSGAVNKITDAETILFENIYSETARDNIIRKLRSFDIITLTIVFKKLFDQYNLMFPVFFLPQIVEIVKATSMSEKLIRTKLIILSLPPSNRYLLDSVCQFFSLIHFISTDKGTDYRENMNIRGFAVVMAPKLFVKTSQDITMDLLNDAITFLDFVFCNSKKIFEIDKDIL